MRSTLLVACVWPFSGCLSCCACGCVQDCLSDWAAALLFDKAAEAAKARGGRKPAAPAAGDDDMDWQEGVPGSSDDGNSAASVFHELRTLLGAISHVGSAAGACLGKLCAGMVAKKKLKAGPVARGLEALIAGEHATAR